MPFSYRITGPHSVVRLDPLVHQFGDFVLCTDLENAKLDLVWETTCERAWKQVHDSAKVLNRLHNTQVDRPAFMLSVIYDHMPCSLNCADP